MSREIVDGRPGQKHGAYIEPITAVCGGLDCVGARNVERIGECGDGCCTIYRCLVCRDEFRVEWPQ